MHGWTVTSSANTCPSRTAKPMHCPSAPIPRLTGIWFRFQACHRNWQGDQARVWQDLHWL